MLEIRSGGRENSEGVNKMLRAIAILVVLLSMSCSAYAKILTSKIPANAQIAVQVYDQVDGGCWVSSKQAASRVELVFRQSNIRIGPPSRIIFALRANGGYQNGCTVAYESQVYGFVETDEFGEGPLIIWSSGTGAFSGYGKSESDNKLNQEFEDDAKSFANDYLSLMQRN